MEMGHDSSSETDLIPTLLVRAMWTLVTRSPMSIIAPLLKTTALMVEKGYIRISLSGVPNVDEIPFALIISIKV